MFPSPIGVLYISKLSLDNGYMNIDRFRPLLGFFIFQEVLSFKDNIHWVFPSPIGVLYISKNQTKQ